MGVRLLFDKLLAPALAAAGLRSADALFRLGGDPDATSLVTMVDVPVDGTVGRFHLKRYYYPNWAASKGLLGRGTGWGTAPELQEFKNLEFLRQKGVSAEDYVRESIVDPSAFAVKGYSGDTMPGDFEDKLTPKEIDTLVEYLLGLGQTGKGK